ncbi:MAG: lipoate protein ligase C-terminal domain-containing protein [Thermoproteota archaeon]|nr:lipoate protein ligase C-terminal domain-containing protein [Thermoproteota archaeon]
MGKALRKVEGGKMIKVQLTKLGGKIEKIKITGDFFLHPEEIIEELERVLVGEPLEAENILQVIRDLTCERDVTFLGASPEDFMKCILMAGGKDD